jgi:hypothetical protein
LSKPKGNKGIGRWWDRAWHWNEIQNRCITIVDKILSIKARNPKADTLVFEKQLDEMVYKLYDLTNEEVKTIDLDFWLSNEEYSILRIE